MLAATTFWPTRPRARWLTNISKTNIKPTFPNSNSTWNCQALYHEPLARVIVQALPVFDIKFDFSFTFTFNVNVDRKSVV